MNGLEENGFQMCTGSEAGSYSRFIDIVSLNSRLESNTEEEEVPTSQSAGDLANRSNLTMPQVDRLVPDPSNFGSISISSVGIKREKRSSECAGDLSEPAEPPTLYSQPDVWCTRIMSTWYQIAGPTQSEAGSSSRCRDICIAQL